MSSDPNEKVSKYQFNPKDEKEKWIPLDDSHIRDHINGKAPIALFQKNLKDQLHFGVIDFDYPWDYKDVAEVQKLIMQQYEVPCYLSASSRKGWHLTFFFSEWTDMRLFISFWEHIYVVSGVAKDVREGRMSFDGKYYKPPELFPTKASYGDNKVMSLSCKAIKPPMVENRMRYGFNAYFKEMEGAPVQVVDQWEYLEKTVQLKPEYMEHVLKTHNIALYDPKLTIVIDENGEERGYLYNTEPIKPKGSFSKLIKNCPALADALNQESPDHASRVALGIFAAHTEGGEEDLIAAVVNKTGWDIDKTKKYLAGIREKRYVVPTCENLQKNGVCKKGIHPVKGNKDHCLEPRKNDEGIDIRPSPYRFALHSTKKEEATFGKLSRPIQDALAAINECAKESRKKGDPQYDNATRELKSAMIKALMNLEDMPASDRNEMNEFLDGLDITAKEMKAFSKEAQKRRKDQFNKDTDSDRSIISMTGKKFTQRDNRYIMLTMDDKGNEKQTILSEFVINIEKATRWITNLSMLSGSLDSAIDSKTNVFYSGYMRTSDLGGKTPKSEYRFKDFSADKFFDQQMNVFLKEISSRGSAGIDIIYEKGFENQIRNCIAAFHKMRSMHTKKHFIVGEPGWNQDMYIVENVIISKDGIMPTDSPVAIDGGEYFFDLAPEDWSRRMPDPPPDRSGLPYFEKITKDEDVRDLLSHFIRDYLSWHESPITYVGAGFAFAAALQDLVGIKSATGFSPILFFVGLSGKGKTEVLKVMQKFYGPWNNTIKLSSKSSYKSIIDTVPYFNDMMVCMDDYKKSFMPSKELANMVHAIFDRGVRTGLDKNSKMKDVKPCKGFVAIGGEDIFDGETSAAARCLVVDFQRYSKQEDNQKQYDLVVKHKDKYSAITAHLIKYCLQLRYDVTNAANHEKVKEWYLEGMALFQDKGEHVRDNSERVTKNIALVYMSFKALLEMCLHEYHVIDQTQYDGHLQELIRGCNKVVTYTFSKIVEDKAGISFIKEVSELLSTESEKYYIIGYGQPAHGSAAKCIGWKDKDNKTVNLVSSIILTALKDKYKTDRVFQSAKTIGETLIEDKHIELWQDSCRPYRKLRHPTANMIVDVLSLKEESLFGLDRQSERDPYDPPPTETTSVRQQVKNYAPGAEIR